MTKLRNTRRRGACVLTADHTNHSIQAGTVWINDWVVMRDEFEEGGYKQSGRGRLCGLAQLEDFLEYIDHDDGVGTGITGTERKHRIEKAAVVTQVQAAGFTLLQDAAFLANPQDDHQANVFDPAILGQTDKFVLVFRKRD